MKRILVPVDGSEMSLRALGMAIDARAQVRPTPELHVLTVQAPILSRNVTRFFSAEEIDAYYQEEARETLNAARDVLDAANVTAHEKMLVGPVAQTIADYVRQQGCDHIFMGTRGLGAVGSLVLGSVALKLLSLVETPVTLVP